MRWVLRGRSQRSRANREAEKEARKAARIDVSIRKNALQTAESYRGRAPSKTDIFTEGKSGEVIKFTCWIGSSVTVPEI